ncbi:MAG: hypothetical protein IPG59_01805 [Candidatus Melainabacteria bacterium]|nr:MAG: hypothetical protein IPG59_01805 [Candidatus Melainabacteria bacterium]
MSHEEQKLNRKFESSERTLSKETNSVDAPISTRGEQAEAHQAAHKDDVTLSDTSLKAVTSGLQVDYEPLMLVDTDADGRVRALATSEAPPSFIELKALEMEATNNPAFEPIVELKRFARTLPAGQDKADMYQLAQDLARSLRSKELLSENQDQASDKLPAITPTFNLSATKFELQDEPIPSATTFHPERLADFAGSAANRAVDFLTDRQVLDQFVQDEREKFIGIGEGLNEAKENVKALARAGWTSVTDGTAIMMMLKACDIANDLELLLMAGCATGSWLYNEVPHLGEKIAASSDRYSHMSKREQGRVIGNAMFDFLSVDAAVEFPHLFSKGLKNEIANEKAIDNILQVLVSSARDRAGQLGVDRIRSVLSVAKDVISSGEFHKLLEDAVIELVQTGPRRVLAPAGVPFDDQFLMMMGGKGGEGFWEGTKRIWKEIRDKPLTPKQLHELEENVAREKMTEKMVDKVAENTEHHMRCKKAVFDLPFEDLIALYIREHKFIFPETLESVLKKEAKESADVISELNILNENLPGVTLTKSSKYANDVSVVPKKYVHHLENTLIENSTLHSIEGIVRHEAGQQLSQVYKWSEYERIYDSEKFVLKTLFNRLKESSLDPSERIKIKTIDRLLRRNYIDNSAGFYQTVADLYAIANGGSPIPKIDRVLKDAFRELYSQMENTNWFRK